MDEREVSTYEKHIEVFQRRINYLSEMPAKTTRLHVVMRKDELDMIDAWAGALHANRSEIARSLIRHTLQDPKSFVEWLESQL